MHVLGIATGSSVEADAVIDPLLERLAGRGTVGVVRNGNPGPSRSVFEIGPDGWRAAGQDLDPTSALSQLARDRDYALLVDFPEYRVSQVAIGDIAVDNPVLTFENADTVDVSAVMEAIEAAEPFESLESLVARVKRSPEAEYSGAIATFTGRVRAKEHEDDDFTESLTFEQYEGVAAERMGEIEAELEEREGVLAVAMHHRTGRIEYGEDIVFVVVLAGHREEAFRTVEDGINRLKAEVPIFKKEVTLEEEFWVHERA